MRHAAKRDLTEPAIVAALEAHGVTVFRVSDAGIPDLLCAYRGQWVVMEVKSPGGGLTKAQKAFVSKSASAGVRIPVVQTPEEALAAMKEQLNGGSENVQARIAGWPQDCKNLG